MGYAVGMLGVLIARYARGIREPSMTATTAMVSVAGREPAHAYPRTIGVTIPSPQPSASSTWRSSAYPGDDSGLVPVVVYQ